MVEQTKTKIVIRLILFWTILICAVIFLVVNLSACESQSEETAVTSNESIVEAAEVIEAESVKEPETKLQKKQQKVVAIVLHTLTKNRQNSTISLIRIDLIEIGMFTMKMQ